MKGLFVVILMLVAGASIAGQKAITDTGEEVILNVDGTWEYSNGSDATIHEIKTNTELFQKSQGSTFSIKSTLNNSAIWINPKQWSFTKEKDGESDAEYIFEFKGGDLYGMAITEEIEISPEALADIALENARSEAPDAKIVEKEYRTVNGNNVIYLEICCTIQGMKITYLGYYYSDSSGTTQLVTYTGTNLVQKYKSMIFDLLNGLDIQ